MEATPQPAWITALRIILQLLIPVIMILTSVRLLMTNSFIRFNYAIPGFPDDRYGFTMEDRQHYAPIALEYLHNDQGIEFLGDQSFEDGAPVYNVRELQHMEDVKDVTAAALTVWRVSILAAVVLGLAIWRAANSVYLFEALIGGAKLTAILMAVLLVGIVIGFSVLFVGFHEVFFDPGTWTFNFSDTLIRLFPQRFWEVAFATVAAGTLIQAGILYLFSRFLLARSG